jgi:outer membrane protein TolC
MKQHSIFGAGALLGAIALSGCMVGPNYKTPTAPTAPSYSDSGHYGDWTTAAPADATARGDWWAVYHNAELSDLEQRCAKANQDIQAALHAYEQAHDIVRENHASLYPTVSLGGYANRNKLSTNKPLRPAGQSNDYWDFLIPLNITWEPDLWGAIRRQIESSSATAQATAADLESTRLSLQGSICRRNCCAPRSTPTPRHCS